MGIDLLVLDDEPSICALLTCMAGTAGLSVVAFQSGLSALDYLRGSQELPRAYFVDMKTADPGGRNFAELDSPEKIFEYLRNKGAIEEFYFMTGHVGEHDRLVLERTKARVVGKPVEMLRTVSEVIARLTTSSTD